MSRTVIGRPIWDMLGARMPRGVLGLSDPDLHLIDGRWVMYIGGFSSGFRNRLYRARLPAGGVPERGRWLLDRHPIVAGPPAGAWDAGGMHTPSYVPPHGGRGARIYYAGRSNARHYGTGSTYAIGLLTRDPRGRGIRRRCCAAGRGGTACSNRWPSRSTAAIACGSSPPRTRSVPASSPTSNCT
ncbi:hypothetical protein JCM9534A_65660 [Catenuloplanes indicus JCM 9534]|uniref:Uncharacterized protein n=1 Tax=Catenuloplanes indicus TaxID=137267 RepID=A0AAE3W7K2_9ACTN|nr:hypothetical protein [Catenuloplanes indicus]